MIRNKKILSVILATVIVSNIIVVKPYALANDEELYKIAYDATVRAVENKTQRDINEARKAIANIPLKLEGARGEFSKQVDTVQNSILVDIVNAIERARALGDQNSINEARRKLSLDLPSEWRASYSEAIDGLQKNIINKVIDSIGKVKNTNSKDDIRVARELLNMLKTVEDNEAVKVWYEKTSQEFEGYVNFLEKELELVDKMKATKLKENPRNKESSLCYISVTFKDKNIDITDQIINVTSEFLKDTKVSIVGVGERVDGEFLKNERFAIENWNGQERIILKNINTDILDKKLSVCIRVQHLGNVKDYYLDIIITCDEEKENKILKAFNKFRIDRERENAEIKLKKDEDMYKLLMDNKDILRLPEEFLCATEEEKKLFSSIYRENIKIFLNFENVEEKDKIFRQSIMDSSNFESVEDIELSLGRNVPEFESTKLCANTNEYNIYFNKLKNGDDITYELIKANKPLSENITIEVLLLNALDMNNKTIVTEALGINDSKRLIVKDSSKINNDRMRALILVRYTKNGRDLGLYLKEIRFKVTVIS